MLAQIELEHHVMWIEGSEVTLFHKGSGNYCRTLDQYETAMVLAAFEAGIDMGHAEMGG